MPKTKENVDVAFNVFPPKLPEATQDVALEQLENYLPGGMYFKKGTSNRFVETSNNQGLMKKNKNPLS